MKKRPGLAHFLKNKIFQALEHSLEPNAKKSMLTWFGECKVNLQRNVYIDDIIQTHIVLNRSK